MAEENLYTPDCIRTFTGIYMNVFKPKPEMICIEDIAHALAQQPRFGGHLPNFYSVAQHSLNCSYLVDEPHLQLAALLHDASEAYLMDMPKPIKVRLADYNALEDRLMKLIAKVLGFKYPLDTEVKTVDEIMLHCEWNHLMLGKGNANFAIDDERQTEKIFLKKFHEYNAAIKREQSLKKVVG